MKKETREKDLLTLVFIMCVSILLLNLSSFPLL
jgi:hypothetical protein